MFSSLPHYFIYLSPYQPFFCRQILYFPQSAEKTALFQLLGNDFHKNITRLRCLVKIRGGGACVGLKEIIQDSLCQTGAMGMEKRTGRSSRFSWTKSTTLSLSHSPAVLLESPSVVVSVTGRVKSKPFLSKHNYKVEHAKLWKWHKINFPSSDPAAGLALLPEILTAAG